MNFTTSLNTIVPLNAYNNNVVVFKQDNVTIPEYAIITIDGLTFKLYPNSSDEFYFNFKEVFKVIVNEDRFADDQDFDISSKRLYLDSNLHHEFTINFSIYEVGNGTETDTDSIDVAVIKRADQIEDFKIGKTLDFNLESTISYHLLQPYHITEVYTWFYGHQFDLGILYVGVNNIDLKFKNNSTFDELELEETFIPGINRFLIDDGTTNLVELGTMFFREGENEIHLLSSSDELILSFKVIRINNSCGEYIKFINSKGSWSYWLFDRNINYRESKVDYVLNNDFESLSNSEDLEIITKKNSNDYITLYTSNLSREQAELIADLIQSPKVYRQLSNGQWINQLVKDGQVTLSKTHARKYVAQIELKKPNNNTLST